MKKDKTYNKQERGFTMIEFLVILSIFSIMAGVTLFNFRGFESNISLTNLAHDVALTIREAQVLGVSATESLELPETFISTKTRGVLFSFNAQTGEFEKTFHIFADTSVPSNGYQENSGDVILDSHTVKSNDRISKILIEGTNTDFEAQSDVYITFSRPKPDAKIMIENQRGGVPAAYSKATITLESPSGRERSVEVYRGGQVRVKR